MVQWNDYRGGIRLSKQIVVPIDGTNKSYAIIPYALELARTYGDEVMFLNVQPSLQELGYPAIKKAGSLVVDEGVPFRAKVRIGIPAMEIVAESASPDVRFIVLAKGRGSEEAIGSVTEHVLKLATCPVVFVPPAAL